MAVLRKCRLTPSPQQFRGTSLGAMPSLMPVGQPAPRDGSLPERARSEIALRPLGIYIHVPFCTTRCGYCDFNTYTAAELGPEPGASRASFVDAAIQEIELAARVLGPNAPVMSTIFVGGGTPTVLPPDELGRLVTAVRDHFGLAEDAEVTTESNPESVDAAGLHRLRGLGFNRISFGMQSAVPHVLATLDRMHSPGRPQQAIAEAKTAGFANTSLDLIYGTPGESASDWHGSLDAALAASPEHISAYALIVEDGTRLAARIRRRELPAPDDDDLADKYLIAEERLTAAGYTAYEVSNWSTSAATRCRHNLGYWRSHHWWGIGPGAHSHVGGVRWWNVKHPRTYASRLAAGLSPAHAREVLSAEQRRVERIMLELRLADGLSTLLLTATEQDRLADLLDRRLAVVQDHMLILTTNGRLLADAVVRELLD
jgi:putative oxygen-independent coproporphyrinogen III oxidase